MEKYGWILGAILIIIGVALILYAVRWQEKHKTGDQTHGAIMLGLGLVVGISGVIILGVFTPFER